MSPPTVTPYAGPLIAALPPERRNNRRDAFVYTANALPLAANGTSTITVSINSDADFALVATTRTVFQTDNTTVVANPAILVSISNSGTGRLLTDAPVQIENMFGTAQFPFIFPVPIYLTAGSQLSITMQNLDAANARNVRLAFHGLKVYV